MAFITIPAADVDQGSIIDEALMSGKIKNNFDDHETRILALEGGGGGGGGTASADSQFATILAGGEDDVAKFWKRRFHVMQSRLDETDGDHMADLEQLVYEDRFNFDSSYGVINQIVANVQGYMGFVRRIEANEKMSFKIKKGENFFCIIHTVDTDDCSDWSIDVDGVNANTLGLVDERGTTVLANFSNVQTGKYGVTKHFYGLDGEEHLVTLTNNAGGEMEITALDVGFRTNDYAIDHTVKISSGRANVGGSEVNFAEGLHSFTKPTEGLSQGYTGMLKINGSGTVTAVDGLSPAKTEVRPDIAVAFSGAVTSLPVKNHFQFPLAGGICMFQGFDNSIHMFSYATKGQAGGPQTQTLDSIIWQSQPREDYTFLPDHSFGTNEFRGDGRIEYWAKPPIEVNGTNNKVDFEITVNGTTTLHAATLTSGYYSSDLVPIEKAFKEAMQAAKSIDGEYFLIYNESGQLYNIGTSDGQVSEIKFLFNTGANSGSSFGPLIGQTNDLVGSTSYDTATQVQHKAQRVFVEDAEHRSPLHSSIKATWSRSQDDTEAKFEETAKRYGFETYRRETSATNFIEIYPDDDCMGIVFYTSTDDNTSYLSYQIDHGDRIFLGQPDRALDSTTPFVEKIIPYFISLPKGSSKIVIRGELASLFEVENSTNERMNFYGYRQYFGKPPWEGLLETEKVLRTVEVAPIRLFGTRYANNAALYTPQASDDNINTLTESGTWAQTASGSIFNGRFRGTVTNGGYIDIEFVLQGDGGGVALGTFFSTAESRKVKCYISDVAINESTDQVELLHPDWGADLLDQEMFQHIGLKAGTYFCRIKNEDTTRLTNAHITIYDTVPPQANAPTVTDINNTGQGVAFPLYTKKRNYDRYAIDKVPDYGTEGITKAGKVSHFDYQVATHTVLNPNDDALVLTYHLKYYSEFLCTNTGDYTQYSTFCRSMSPIVGHFASHTTAIQPSIDGRNINTISSREQVKGGFAPTSTANSPTEAVFAEFNFPCAFSASLTYTMGNTIGLRENQKAILVDNVGATEEVFVENIVVDTSFDIKKALSVLTPANIVKIEFPGFHNVKLESVDAVDYYMHAMFFEPLPLTESILEQRLNPVWKEYADSDVQIFTTGAVARATLTTHTLNVPVFKNGERPNESNTVMTPGRLYYSNSETVNYNCAEIRSINYLLSSYQVKHNQGDPNSFLTYVITSEMYVRTRKFINDAWERVVRG